MASMAKHHNFFFCSYLRNRQSHIPCSCLQVVVDKFAIKRSSGSIFFFGRGEERDYFAFVFVDRKHVSALTGGITPRRTGTVTGGFDLFAAVFGGAVGLVDEAFQVHVAALELGVL